MIHTWSIFLSPEVTWKARTSTRPVSGVTGTLQVFKEQVAIINAALSISSKNL